MLQEEINRRLMDILRTPLSEVWNDAIVWDDYGQGAVKCGPDCDMQVVRPGKFQCNCEYQMAGRDNDLSNTTDASVWAEHFVQRVEEKPSIATDFGAIHAWFAFAIESTRFIVQQEMASNESEDQEGASS